MDWSECKKRQIVKESSIDKNLISSLVQSSERKLATDKFAPLSEITASTKIANNYDSMREVLEALSISRGFKIYNHDCFVGFILEVLKTPSEANCFDKLRKIRNGINYYGKNVGVEDAKKIIKELNELRIKFLNRLNE
ncbi:hypothetical protein KAJ38_02785 [Candidatus Pacearchaeota archaeon]|nr:hypothetical protein [Candidatus Pacearchaeota archaeon]